MTNQERQRLMDFVLLQQAALAVKLDMMLEGRQHDEAAREREHARATARINRLERVVTLMARAGLRARSEWRAHAAAIKEQTEAMRERDTRIQTLVDTQLHTEKIVSELTVATQQNSIALGELTEIMRRHTERQRGNGDAP